MARSTGSQDDKNAHWGIPAEMSVTVAFHLRAPNSTRGFRPTQKEAADRNGRNKELSKLQNIANNARA